MYVAITNFTRSLFAIYSIEAKPMQQNHIIRFLGSIILLSSLLQLPMTVVAEPVTTMKAELPALKGRQKLELLEKLNKELIRQSAKEQYYYAAEQLKLARQTGDSSFVAKAIFNIGEYYYNFNNYPEAKKYYSEAAVRFKKAQDWLHLASAFNNISIIYQLRGEFPSALRYSHRSLEIAERLHSWDDISDALNNIGAIHMYSQNYQLSLDALKRALTICLKHKDWSRTGITYNTIGIVYNKIGRTDLGLKYFTAAHDIYKANGDWFKTAFIANNIGSVFIHRNEPQLASPYEEESYRLFKKASYYNGISNSLVNLMDINYRQGNYVIGDKQAAECLTITQKKGLREIRFSALDIYRKSLEKRGNYKKAYLIYQNYIALKDSMFDEEKTRQITDIQTRYETKQKIREISDLKKENKIKQLEVKQRNLQLNLLVLLSLLFIALVVFFHNRYIAKQKMNRLLEAKNQHIITQNIQMHKMNEVLQISEKKLKETNSTKDKFFSIIAHDLKNPFHTILGFAGLIENQKNKLNREDLLSFSHSIYNSATKVYRLLDNLLNWARSQSGNLKFQPGLLDPGDASEASISILEPLAIEKHITIQNKVCKGEKITSDTNMIDTVLRNLINNAIKFTHPEGIIIVSGQLHGDYYTFSIEDNGVGIKKESLDQLFQISSGYKTQGTQEEEGSGLGLLVCYEFVKNMAGTIQVKSIEGQGSCFSFTIPVSPGSSRQ